MGPTGMGFSGALVVFKKKNVSTSDQSSRK